MAVVAAQITDRAGDDRHAVTVRRKPFGELNVPGPAGFSGRDKSLMDQKEVHDLSGRSVFQFFLIKVSKLIHNIPLTYKYND